uniref:Uncharacterized protein n=1 Tax=Avena sativa TaxID=4498 RepID=A0ACD5Z6P1_AVESA
MQKQLHSSCKKFSNGGFPVPSLGCALVMLLVLLSIASPASSCTEQEKGSLLQFLGGLSRDGGLRASWERNGTDCCTWKGVTCGVDGAVTDISLALKGLEGRISPSLGNLAGLLRLNLSHNSLSGGLPLELVSSSSIIVLDVSFNRLKGDIQELPSSTPARPLQVLNISSNLFTGQFPSSTRWEMMNNLVALNASNNSFTGNIPSNFCRGSPSLAVVVLCYNQFTGSIPPGFGNCSMLRVLKAGHNNLSGPLPNELFDASSLEYLSLPDNALHGVLDGAQIVKLRNLATLDLGGNNFSGKIPDSIGQLKRLEELHLGQNNMSGELPSALSNCTNLITVDLKSNNFSGELAKVNFSSLLDLKTLDLLYNNFTGTIPESLYSCSELAALRISGNNLHGQLSPKIASLKSLTFLSFGFNNFANITNTLQILKNCRNLTSLLIGGNFKGESMPDDEIVDGFQNLQFLSIAGCSLSGNIPLWLSKLTKLEMLFLQDNQLSGPIPGWINSLNLLFHLDISNNSLTGEIPRALMEMPMLNSEKITVPRLDPRAFELPVYAAPSRQYRITSAFPKVLNLGNNNFTGVIPEEIGKMNSLVILNFSSNSLSGEIPQQLCNLTNLWVLDLSSNNLTGIIPSALKNLHFLSAFNISHNDLEGPIPDGVQLSTFPSSSFDGNPKLCGRILHRDCGSAKIPSGSRKHWSKKSIFAITFGVFFGGTVILFVLGCLLAAIKHTSFITKNRSSNNGDVELYSIETGSEESLVIVPRGKGEDSNLTFADIVKATNNFHQDNIIGCGGYGLVYRADLPDGARLAIKKLNDAICLMDREFTAEVDALSMAQHDNLVPLWGYGIQGDSRFLIYPYMENGSLDDWLHNRDGDTSSFLDWPARLKIAQGAGRGLSYIHGVCKPHIVHRDIKSSNILLDREFKAYVADFGLSRLIDSKTHFTTELVGTLGYIPPEYGQGWVATLRGDMYSFGMVLLELLTGRRPVMVLSSSKELVNWVQEMKAEGKQLEVLDPTLQGTGYEEQMMKVLEAACKCVSRNPCMRPTIQELVALLESVDAKLQMQNSVKIECS